MPPLLKLDDVEEYRKHYIQSLCRQRIETHDGIRVYFHPKVFDHAFFENSDRTQSKDKFSKTRSQRMDWIAAGLSDPTAPCVQGWLPRHETHTLNRRVTVVHGFVIVIELGRKQNTNLKANFVTCYRGSRNAARTLKSPTWTRNAYYDASIENGR